MTMRDGVTTDLRRGLGGCCNSPTDHSIAPFRPTQVTRIVLSSPVRVTSRRCIEGQAWTSQYPLWPLARIIHRECRSCTRCGHERCAPQAYSGARRSRALVRCKRIPEQGGAVPSCAASAFRSRAEPCPRALQAHSGARRSRALVRRRRIPEQGGALPGIIRAAILAPRFATRRSRVSGAADTAAHGALRNPDESGSRIATAAALPTTLCGV